MKIKYIIVNIISVAVTLFILSIVFSQIFGYTWQAGIIQFIRRKEVLIGVVVVLVLYNFVLIKFIKK
ncbi:MAG: hypothetical protein P9X24_12140 [Candidatus Hatepunaea meridiana]|nr:hypothetical protein [Candidatus Hatepunaea meridiana]